MKYFISHNRSGVLDSGPRLYRKCARSDVTGTGPEIYYERYYPELTSSPVSASWHETLEMIDRPGLVYDSLEELVKAEGANYPDLLMGFI